MNSNESVVISAKDAELLIPTYKEVREAEATYVRVKEIALRLTLKLAEIEYKEEEVWIVQPQQDGSVVVRLQVPSPEEEEE
jgi:hypothetical protein